MKVELWAKKIGEKGHVFLNTVNIPEGKMEWFIPVQQPLRVGYKMDVETTPQDTTSAVRVFRHQYNPLDSVTDPKPVPKFLEV